MQIAAEGGIPDAPATIKFGLNLSQGTYHVKFALVYDRGLTASELLDQAALLALESPQCSDVARGAPHLLAPMFTTSSAMHEPSAAE